MSERYVRLFSLPENLYSAGAPVVVAAGALLKDNQSGRMLAQLKLRNISSKIIKAATVSVIPFDTVGNPLGEAIRHQYLDLNVARDEDFGQKVVIALPKTATRSFSVIVDEVVFATNTLWTDAGAPWESLPIPKSLSAAFANKELEKQYCIQYGNMAKYVPNGVKDVWYCTCGALNRNTEKICHRCNVSLTDLLAFDMDALKKECAVRLEAERKQKALAAAKAKKKKRLAIIVAPILVILVVIAVLVAGMKNKADAYNAAITLLENGQYDDAIAAFSDLGNYKDCAEQIIIARENKNAEELEKQYNTALDYIASGKISDAVSIFEALGDYKDCKAQIAALEIPLIKEHISNIGVGGSFTLGTYEQDNNEANGAEPIEWIVLQSDQPGFPCVIAISKYVLDAQPFHNEKGYITWENCSLRTWLNNDFLSAAFTVEEGQQLLAATQLSNPDNPRNGTDCGNDTMDIVFLLNALEATSFADIVGDETPTTAYAQSKGLREKASWMFRTVYEGNETNDVCVAYWITEFGSTRSSIDKDNGVRPCIVFNVGN